MHFPGFIKISLPRLLSKLEMQCLESYRIGDWKSSLPKKKQELPAQMTALAGTSVKGTNSWEQDQDNITSVHLSNFYKSILISPMSMDWLCTHLST